jgi:UDP-N-acetylglucosamine 2-epimerase (non-hydrolysing)
MLDQVLTAFGITPDVDLNIMQPNQTLARLTSRAIEAVDQYLGKDNPDFVLVQGDTTTVFCAALAAFYRKIPIGHVEAGLRTRNLQAPWPEEANRVLVSRVAALHFAPTEGARQNLLVEGVPDKAITVTGNTVIDALFLALEKVRSNPPTIGELPDFLQPSNNGGNCDPRLVLITGHRRENFGEGFEDICHAIADLAQRFPDVHFVYPVHLNPNVREPVMRILRNKEIKEGANVHLIEPLPYLPFIAMAQRATLILTDSGGVQEEAPSLGKPVLVMRETTERPEAVIAGTVRLVGAIRERILDEVSRLLTDQSAYHEMSRVHNPYGDGNAARKIVRTVRHYLGAGLST